MEEKVKISIDLMGGDNSPDKTLLGIDLFIKRNKIGRASCRERV